jgi:hypothetical protein
MPLNSPGTHGGDRGQTYLPHAQDRGVTDKRQDRYFKPKKHRKKNTQDTQTEDGILDGITQNVYPQQKNPKNI